MEITTYFLILYRLVVDIQLACFNKYIHLSLCIYVYMFVCFRPAQHNHATPDSRHQSEDVSGSHGKLQKLREGTETLPHSKR